uniref:Uncharacterized protein n=1 Tax=Arundo donax TaxID=35708 RepID=A0A0A9ETB5_ARUDO
MTSHFSLLRRKNWRTHISPRIN